MWTINQMEQLSPFGGVSQMSHRDEPRSGRGCFGAVVVVPFLALGGMFALIALTGSPDDAPLAAPAPARPTSQWWTEPFETGTTMSTVTETVVVEGAAREVRAARLATQTRVAVSTVTETVRTTGTKPAATGRNEPPAGPGDVDPVEAGPTSTSDSPAPPVVTSSSSVVTPAPPTLQPPASTVPTVPATGSPAPTPSTPRSEDPVPPSTTAPSTPAPPCERGEPVPSVPQEPAERAVPSGEVSAEVGLELPLPSPAEVSSTSSAPSAGV